MGASEVDGVGPGDSLPERFVVTLERREWDAWAALLDPDVVYEIPQTRERIRGLDNYLRFNQEYPGEWHVTPKVVIADDAHGVVWFDWVVGDESADGVAFFELSGDRITKVVDFWPEPYEPPAGREHLTECY